MSVEGLAKGSSKGAKTAPARFPQASVPYPLAGRPAARDPEPCRRIGGAMRGLRRTVLIQSVAFPHRDETAEEQHTNHRTQTALALPAHLLRDAGPSTLHLRSSLNHSTSWRTSCSLFGPVGKTERSLQPPKGNHRSRKRGRRLQPSAPSALNHICTTRKRT